MGIFGWDYPPGVSSLPWDHDYPCDVCGEFEDDCICPECPVCGDFGNASCYPMHGLHRSHEQKWNMACKEQQWEMDNYSADRSLSDAYAEADSILNEVV